LCLHKGAPLATSSIQLTDSAFKLSHALLLALVVGGVSLLSAGLQAWWGHTGALLTAMLVAMVEIHAAAASLAQLSLASDMPMNLVTWSLVAVLASSAVAKTLLAFISGGAGFGWRVALGLAAMVTGASLTLLLQPA
jgi:uncharacterized membrane protein (DUF4010 family)